MGEQSKNESSGFVNLMLSGLRKKRYCAAGTIQTDGDSKTIIATVRGQGATTKSRKSRRQESPKANTSKIDETSRRMERMLNRENKMAFTTRFFLRLLILLNEILSDGWKRPGMQLRTLLQSLVNDDFLERQQKCGGIFDDDLSLLIFLLWRGDLSRILLGMGSSGANIQDGSTTAEVDNLSQLGGGQVGGGYRNENFEEEDPFYEINQLSQELVVDNKSFYHISQEIISKPGSRLERILNSADLEQDPEKAMVLENAPLIYVTENWDLLFSEFTNDPIPNPVRGTNVTLGSVNLSGGVTHGGSVTLGESSLASTGRTLPDSSLVSLHRRILVSATIVNSESKTKNVVKFISMKRPSHFLRMRKTVTDRHQDSVRGNQGETPQEGGRTLSQGRRSIMEYDKNTLLSHFYERNCMLKNKKVRDWIILLEKIVWRYMKLPYEVCQMYGNLSLVSYSTTDACDSLIDPFIRQDSFIKHDSLVRRQGNTNRSTSKEDSDDDFHLHDVPLGGPVRLIPHIVKPKRGSDLAEEKDIATTIATLDRQEGSIRTKGHPRNERPIRERKTNQGSKPAERLPIDAEDTSEILTESALIDGNWSVLPETPEFHTKIVLELARNTSSFGKKRNKTTRSSPSSAKDAPTSPASSIGTNKYPESSPKDDDVNNITVINLGDETVDKGVLIGFQDLPEGKKESLGYQYHRSSMRTSANWRNNFYFEGNENTLHRYHTLLAKIGYLATMDKVEKINNVINLEESKNRRIRDQEFENNQVVIIQHPNYEEDSLDLLVQSAISEVESRRRRRQKTVDRKAIERKSVKHRNDIVQSSSITTAVEEPTSAIPVIATGMQTVGFQFLNMRSLSATVSLPDKFRSETSSRVSRFSHGEKSMKSSLLLPKSKTTPEGATAISPRMCSGISSGTENNRFVYENSTRSVSCNSVELRNQFIVMMEKNQKEVLPQIVVQSPFYNLLLFQFVDTNFVVFVPAVRRSLVKHGFKQSVTEDAGSEELKKLKKQGDAFNMGDNLGEDSDFSSDLDDILNDVSKTDFTSNLHSLWQVAKKAEKGENVVNLNEKNHDLNDDLNEDLFGVTKVGGENLGADNGMSRKPVFSLKFQLDYFSYQDAKKLKEIQACPDCGAQVRTSFHNYCYYTGFHFCDHCFLDPASAIAVSKKPQVSSSLGTSISSGSIALGVTGKAGSSIAGKAKHPGKDEDVENVTIQLQPYKAVIPAYAAREWDFQRRNVCRMAYMFLESNFHMPLILTEKVLLVEELNIYSSKKPAKLSAATLNHVKAGASFSLQKRSLPSVSGNSISNSVSISIKTSGTTSKQSVMKPPPPPTSMMSGTTPMMSDPPSASISPASQTVLPSVTTTASEAPPPPADTETSSMSESKAIYPPVTPISEPKSVGPAETSIKKETPFRTETPSKGEDQMVEERPIEEPPFREEHTLKKDQSNDAVSDCKEDTNAGNDRTPVGSDSPSSKQGSKMTEGSKDDSIPDSRKDEAASVDGSRSVNSTTIRSVTAERSLAEVLLSATDTFLAGIENVSANLSSVASSALSKIVDSTHVRQSQLPFVQLQKLRMRVQRVLDLMDMDCKSDGNLLSGADLSSIFLDCGCDISFNLSTSVEDDLANFATTTKSLTKSGTDGRAIEKIKQPSYYSLHILQEMSAGNKIIIDKLATRLRELLSHIENCDACKEKIRKRFGIVNEGLINEDDIDEGCRMIDDSTDIQRSPKSKITTVKPQSVADKLMQSYTKHTKKDRSEKIESGRILHRICYSLCPICRSYVCNLNGSLAENLAESLAVYEGRTVYHKHCLERRKMLTPAKEMNVD